MKTLFPPPDFYDRAWESLAGPRTAPPSEMFPDDDRVHYFRNPTTRRIEAWILREGVPCKVGAGSIQ